MQKVRCHPQSSILRQKTVEAPTDCRHTVSGPFHSPSGVLFTFPSRYLCAIGRARVFSLGRWSSRLPTELPGSSVVLRNPPQVFPDFRLQGFYLLWLTFPGHSANLEIFGPGGKVGLPVVDPATPDIQRAHAFTDIRFGLFPFR